MFDSHNFLIKKEAVSHDSWVSNWNRFSITDLDTPSILITKLLETII